MVSILMLMPPGKVSAGNVNFAGRSLLDLPEREMRQIRGKEIGFIAQILSQYYSTRSIEKQKTGCVT